MKKILFSLMLGSLCSLSLWAWQGEGEERNIDGQSFVLRNDVWVHEALDEGYELSSNFTTVHGSTKWNRWYQEGSPTLQKILDLGPNVIFKFLGQDGEFHVYGVFEDEEKLRAYLPQEEKVRTVLGISPVTAVIVGSAVVVGAVIVDSNNDDDEVSPSRPKN